MFDPHRTAAQSLDRCLMESRDPGSTVRRKARAKGGPREGEQTDPGVLMIAKREKTKALQTALLEHGAEPAMILVILALMGATSTVRIRRSQPEGFGRGAIAAEVLAVFDKYRARFDGWLDDDEPAERGLRLRYWEEGCQVKAFNVLCGFKPCEMHELFAAFVASSLKTCSGYNAALGDAPLAAALAREVNADVSKHWRLDESFLQRCRKPELLEIAVGMGVPHVCSPPLTVDRLKKLKAKELRQIILEFLAVRPEAGALVPAPLRFGEARC